jgi:hypothetical protein
MAQNSLALTLSPYSEDQAICQLAEDLGLELSRFQTIEIYDESLIAAAGLMKQTPDYARIRKALRAGESVEGARFAGVEYKLRRKE